MNPKEKARTRAEEAVELMRWPAWIVNANHLYESELVRAHHEELGVHISIWYDREDAPPDAPLTCEVFNMEKALWVLGVPTPGEVSELLRRYADVATPLYDVPPEHRVDLRTGKVLTEPEVERLLKTSGKTDPEMPTSLDLRRAAHEEARARFEWRMEPIVRQMERTYRALSRNSWEDYAPMYAVGQGNDGDRAVEIVATVLTTRDDETLLLDLSAYYCDTRREVWVLSSSDPDVLGPLAISNPHTERYGRGSVVVPLNDPDEVPTPGQAMRLLELGS